ncbi:MAG: hypothetical protein R6X19_03560 [Kiritimatiellia bacterium]
MLTVKVLDETGEALAGMPVHVWLSESAVRDGQTDSNGLFVAKGACTIKDIPISIVQEGYYDSRLNYSYPNYLSVKDHKWQPWNPLVTVRIRRVKNPIPMFMKRVNAKLPVENATFAFDLQSGDWVDPYGRGQMSDLVFQVTRRVTSPNDYEGTLRLTFTNAFEGIQKAEGMIMESQFQFPRFAPTDGYQTNFVYTHGKDPINGYYGARVDDPQKYYLVRVRSVLDNEGKLKEALYGRLVGDIELSGMASSNNVRIAFTYYLNPTPNDRNLEFDPAKNLFKNLSSSEAVLDP